MLSVLILALDEGPNIQRCLSALTWAREVLVVDSFSADSTLDICRQFSNVRVLQRRFDLHAHQWNFGCENCQGDWILALDADYILSPDIAAELKEFKPREGIDAYFANFTYCINGHPLRTCLYPPRAVLFNKRKCAYKQDGHTQLLRIPAGSGWLNGKILHDDRKPLSRWLINQAKYAMLEAEKLQAADPGSLKVQDRIRLQIILAPILVFFYTLFWRRLVLDGWSGFYYALQRTIAEMILSLYLLESRMGKGVRDE